MVVQQEWKSSHWGAECFNLYAHGESTWFRRSSTEVVRWSHGGRPLGAASRALRERLRHASNAPAVGVLRRLKKSGLPMSPWSDGDAGVLSIQDRRWCSNSSKLIWIFLKKKQWSFYIQWSSTNLRPPPIGLGFRGGSSAWTFMRREWTSLCKSYTCVEKGANVVPIGLDWTGRQHRNWSLGAASCGPWQCHTHPTETFHPAEADEAACVAMVRWACRCLLDNLGQKLQQLFKIYLNFKKISV